MFTVETFLTEMRNIIDFVYVSHYTLLIVPERMFKLYSLLPASVKRKVEKYKTDFLHEFEKRVFIFLPGPIDI